jgi:hypothetical protein
MSEEHVCRIAGCHEKVTQRKPYCIKHLDKLPYVQHLMEMEALRDREEELAKTKNGAKKIDINSSRSKEILIQLAVKGAKSPERLAILIETEPDVIESYATALEKHGLVESMKLGSRRGSPRPVIAITDKGRKCIQSEIDKLAG